MKNTPRHHGVMPPLYQRGKFPFFEGVANPLRLDGVVRTPLALSLEEGNEEHTPSSRSDATPLSEGNVSLLTRRAGEVLRNLKHPAIISLQMKGWQIR